MQGEKLSTHQIIERHRDWLSLGLIVLVGLALRLYRLGAQSLWLDEAFSWLVASQPVGRGLNLALINFVHPPLYYLLLHPVTLVSQSEFALRLPSALLGTLSIVLIYKLGRDLDGREGDARARGLLAAALLAVNPFHVWFSREARNYQLVFVLALLLLYLFHQLLQGRKRWPAFVIISALSYLTHYFTLLLPLVQFLYFLAHFKRRYRLFRRWFLAQVVAALPLGLWLIALFLQEEQSIGIAWIPRPRLITPLLTLWDFALLYAEGWLPWGLFALPLFGLILLLGFQARRRRALLALWLVAPPLTLASISWLMGRYFYVDRYLIISLPAFVLLLAQGLLALKKRVPRNRWLAGAATAVLLLASALSVGQIFWDGDLEKADWRGVGRLLEAGYRQGDLVVLRTVEHIVPLHYYFPDPEWTFLVDNPAPDPWAEIETRAEQIWLVWGNPHGSNHLTAQSLPVDVYSEASPMTQAWLTAHREKILAEHTLPGIVVIQIAP